MQESKSNIPSGGAIRQSGASGIPGRVAPGRHPAPKEYPRAPIRLPAGRWDASASIAAVTSSCSPRPLSWVPLGPARPAKVEAERGVPRRLRDLGRSNDDRIVHVAAVEGVGMADDEPPLGARDEPEPGLQGGTVRNVDREGFFHRNSDLRGSGRNIQGPDRVTAYEVYFQ